MGRVLENVVYLHVLFFVERVLLRADNILRTTWRPRLYFLAEIRHILDFSLALKKSSTSAGIELVIADTKTINAFL